MENKKIIIGILVLMLLVPSVLATSIDIDMKESFGISEQISFDYTITSEESQEIQYITSVNCPNAPLPLLEIKTINLEANIPLTGTYTYMTAVSEDTEPQTCKAIVGILSPEEISEESSFTIETNPSFEFNVLICKDIDCIEKTKVFILNENTYLDYTSAISDQIIIATLTYPDSTTKQLTLPASIKAEQIGTYELEATASKENYKTITKKIQFGVIGQEARIDYTPVSEIITCNKNGICDPGENYENCPEDCIIKRPEPTKRNILNYILIVISIILAIIIFYYYRKHKK